MLTLPGLYLSLLRLSLWLSPVSFCSWPAFSATPQHLCPVSCCSHCQGGTGLLFLILIWKNPREGSESVFFSHRLTLDVFSKANSQCHDQTSLSLGPNPRLVNITRDVGVWGLPFKPCSQRGERGNSSKKKDVDSKARSNVTTLCIRRDFKKQEGLTISLKLVSSVLGLWHFLSVILSFLFFSFWFKAMFISKQFLEEYAAIRVECPTVILCQPFFLQADSASLYRGRKHFQDLPPFLVHGKHPRNIEELLVNINRMYKAPQHSTLSGHVLGD